MAKRKYLRKPFRPVNPEAFLQTRVLARLTQKQAADILHVTSRSIHNWETGKVKIPYSVFRLLRISTGFELPGDSWRGWKLLGDALWSPEGKKFAAAGSELSVLDICHGTSVPIGFVKKTCGTAARSAQRSEQPRTMSLFSGEKR